MINLRLLFNVLVVSGGWLPETSRSFHYWQQQTAVQPMARKSWQPSCESHTAWQTGTHQIKNSLKGGGGGGGKQPLKMLHKHAFSSIQLQPVLQLRPKEPMRGSYALKNSCGGNHSTYTNLTTHRPQLAHSVRPRVTFMYIVKYNTFLQSFLELLYLNSCKHPPSSNCCSR